jgi:tetratricopeptide (TPR) repeat protein
MLRHRASKQWILISWLLAHGSWLAVSAPTTTETAQTHYQAGLAYERLGRLEEAYTRFQLAFALEAEDAWIALGLGVIAVRLGQMEVAQRALERSITLDANSVASYYQLAYLYEKLQQKDRAIDSWNRFLRLNHDPVLKAEARKHIQFLESEKTPAAKPTRLQRVAVEKFQGNGGAELAKECARALSARGVQVVDAKQPVDAILSGVVTEYRPARKLMVVLGTTQVSIGNGQSLTVSNPAVGPGEPLVVTQSPGLALNSPHIMMNNSAIGIATRLRQNPAGTLLGAYDYSYESLDLATARKTVVDAIADSFAR